MNHYIVSSCDLRIDPINNNLSLWLEVSTKDDVIYVDLNKVNKCKALARNEYAKVKKLRNLMCSFKDNRLSREELIFKLAKLKNNSNFLYNLQAEGFMQK